jgi:RHS repeat-associated protein
MHWQTVNRFFCLHDRLGSVREIINTDGAVVRDYTYGPFGQTIEESSNEPQATSNCFMFTGQYFDSEIGQYYLRARQYDPVLFRFTSRDPVFGKFDEPMTLHKYLYCENEPVNRVDLLGLLYTPYGEGPYNLAQTQDVLNSAIMWDKAGLLGALTGHGLFYDPKYTGRAMFDYGGLDFSFTIGSYNRPLEGGEFGNYCAGYALYYDYGMTGLGGAYAGGQFYGKLHTYERPPTSKWYGLSGSGGGIGYDDWQSIFWITKGALDSNRRAQDWFEHPTLNPLLKPGALSDNLFQNCFDKELLRWEEPLLERTTQLSEAILTAEGK